MVNFLCQPNHLKTPRLNISSISGRVFPNEITLELVDSVKLIILQNKSSVQFSCLVMSYPLQPHGLQHTRLSCPSQTPRAYSNSCPLSWWWLPTISSFVISFTSCLQSFPASGSFPMSQCFTSGGQVWFPLGWTGLISCSPRDSQESSTTPQFKASILWCSAFFMVQLSHPYMTIGKTIALTIRTFASKVMSLFFNMLSRFVIVSLPRSKLLLISWLHHHL